MDMIVEKLLKSISYYGQSSHENIYFYDLMGTILKSLNEIS